MTSLIFSSAGLPLVAVTTRNLAISNGRTVRLSIIEIPIEGYSDRMFNECGIEMPAMIANSVVKRKAEYLFGRLAARHALAQYLLGDIQVGTGSARQPIWPPGIIGSISHNRRYAIAIALDGETHNAIGIDLESIISTDMRETLWKTILSPLEQTYLRNLSGLLPLEFLLTVVFSAKESFFKAAFPLVGRHFDFDALALQEFDIERRTLLFEVQQYLCPTLVPGTTRLAHYEIIDFDTLCTTCHW